MFSYRTCVGRTVSSGGSVCEAVIARVFERTMIGSTYIGQTWKGDPFVERLTPFIQRFTEAASSEAGISVERVQIHLDYFDLAFPHNFIVDCM